MSRIAGAIGTRRRRLAVHPRRVDHQRRRMLRATDMTASHRALLERVDTHIDPADAMHTGHTEHYLGVGLSAIEAIEAAGVESARRILDLPCGHGRVLRMLAARFPEASLAAGDVDRDGVKFCADRFRATPVFAPTDPRELRLPGEFDLIWCGSLATHLPERETVALLQALAGALAPGGHLLVTTHGEFVAERLAADPSGYQLHADGVRRALDGYRASGFGYADYPWSPGYGISLIEPAWLAAKAPLPVVHCEERGWDDHQDVHALRRPT